ncbi:unnamed protein product, partial [Meganyctiphanes norvegica]
MMLLKDVSCCPSAMSLVATWLMVLLLSTGAPACPTPCTCLPTEDTLATSSYKMTCVGALVQEVVPDAYLYTHIEISSARLDAIPVNFLRQFRNLQYLNLGKNLISIIQTNDLMDLKYLTDINLHYNRIKTIENKSFSTLTKLHHLNLNENLLGEIPTSITHCSSLKNLFLQKNNISRVHLQSLYELSRLEVLDLSGNPLAATDPQAFAGLPSLKKLILKETSHLNLFPILTRSSELQEIRIDRASLSHIPSAVCHQSSNLQSLIAHRNEIQEIPDLNDCWNLRLLDLGHNQIRSLSPGQFSGLIQLQDLTLHNNLITHIPTGAFTGLQSLKILNLEHNHITYIHSDVFLPLISLKDINLGNNQFPSLPVEGLEFIRSIKVHNNPYLKTFPGPEIFKNAHNLVLSYAYHCCPYLELGEVAVAEDELEVIEEEIIYDLEELDPLIWNDTDIWGDLDGFDVNFMDVWEKMVNNFSSDPLTTESPHTNFVIPRHPVSCIPRPGTFMPCSDLFDWWTLRCGIWIIFLLALLGNATVVVVLISARSKMDVPRFLVTNLAIADFCMGLYLGFLAVVDASSLGEFRMYAISWQMSPGCQVAGFLGVLSSELSVFTLTVITMERNYAITNAMHLNKRLSLHQAAFIMAFGWAFALLMASLPLVGVSDYRKFAICLPFETKDAGLGYIVSLMVINGVAFLTLMGCYLKIYCAIRGSTAWNSNDSRIAKRMALLVFTDFICWAPIAFFSMTAAFGVQLISLEGAKVFTVFFLPLNSCCNPFLYALLTKQFKKDCVNLCKSIEESRVSRGIGRYRHSSNFSNRLTPANTNSAVDSLSRTQDNQNCQCHITEEKLSRVQQIMCLSPFKYLFCTKKMKNANIALNFSYNQSKATDNTKYTSVTSETNSSSLSDSWRRSNSSIYQRFMSRRNKNSSNFSQESTKESSISLSKNGTSTPVLRYSRGGTFASNRSNTLKEVAVKRNVNASSFRFASLREGRNGRSSNTLCNSSRCNSMLLMQKSPVSPIQTDLTNSKIKRSSIFQSQRKSLSSEEENSCPIHKKSQRNSYVNEPEISTSESIIAQKVECNLSDKDSKHSNNCSLLPVNSQNNIDSKRKSSLQNINKYYLSSDFHKRKKCVSLTYLPQEPSKSLTYSYLSENNLNYFNIESTNRVVTTCPTLTTSKELVLDKDEVLKNNIIQSYLKGVEQSAMKTKNSDNLIECKINEKLKDAEYNNINQTKNSTFLDSNFTITDLQDES